MPLADLDSFVREKAVKIYNYLLKFTRQKEDAEDILQEVFIKFMDKRDNINEGAYESYLYRSAHNQAINYLKKKKTEKKSIQKLEIEESIMDEDPEEAGNSLRLKNAFKQLNPKHLLVLDLQYYQKKSYKEIAEIMQTTPSAIDSMLVRAKRELRKIILQESRSDSVLSNRNMRGENELQEN